jgi:hypothetical protein
MPSANLFNDFVASLKSSTIFHKLYSARLALHHPEMPDATQSLELLHVCTIPDADVNSPSFKQARVKRVMLLELCLDTARVLIDQGKYGDATWVMGFAQENFKDELGLNKASDSVVKPEDQADEMLRLGLEGGLRLS